MFDPIHRFIMAGNSVSIDFTKQGWQQFARLNRMLGIRYIRAFLLKRELAEYIAAHEVAGVKLDTECQQVHYDGDVYLVLKKVQGTWLITDIFLTQETQDFAPVYFWTRVKCGCDLLLARVLIGWRCLAKAVQKRQVRA